MSVVNECYTITKTLYKLFQVDGKREGKMEQMTSLLKKRQAILHKVKPPFTPEEEKLGKQIVVMNKVIESEMKKMKKSIERDRNGLKKTKVSVYKYVNPYASLQHDGMFYDKKK
ncbi:hypothetical protein WAK64_11140 [Bacillus spongiae]|uniref:Flagellar protein FliT n=1 Tax=Bacillus spongiae TaxID=2683610 RepID=A0ABU8HED6_9BACI